MSSAASPQRSPAAFDESLVLTDTARRWFATIGQFSIIRLERDTQLLIPAYDYGRPIRSAPARSPRTIPARSSAASASRSRSSARQHLRLRGLPQHEIRLCA
ncbi:MAG: hypothetical protein V8S87_07675 [Oscillospiraceae bacterium]